jgi:phospholipid/cholesterol/gamma-HCH transport system substrate-binding protein
MAIVVALVVAALVWRLDRPQRSLSAIFTSTVGVHPGSDVRVLGVRIGEVTAVTPQGRTVRVVMRYDARRDLPADATAVIVPPSVVSDRYVQITPVYTTGPVLAEGAELPASRTVIPLEVDDVYRSLDALDRALGPNGANQNGALADLIATARQNLEGNGDSLHATLAGLSDALTTVANGRDDLFGTIANLSEFTNALARSDAAVREFNQRLADVGEQLAAERDDLAAALRNLATALSDIKTFVRENREALASNVAALADVTGILARQQKALIQVLDVAPLALSNLNLAYNARSGTLDTRDNPLGPYDAAAYVCSLMVNLVPPAKIPATCFDLAKLLAQRHLPMTDALRKLIGLAPLPKSGAGQPGPAATPPAEVDPPDLTLGGILRGGS